MKVLLSVLIGVSTINQAKLIEKLLREKGYDVEYKNYIHFSDINNKDVYGAIWFQLCSTEYISPIIPAYVMSKKPKIVYITIEGVPYGSILSNENINQIEFICNSNFTKECLEKAGLRVKDVVHHAIDISLSENILSSINKQEESNGKCKLIYVGRHDPRKNLQALSNAIDILNSKIPDDYILYLITDPSAKDLFNKKNCVYLGDFGSFPYTEVLKYIAMSNYMVFPSWSEGFGLPVLEANSLGIPVIHCWFPPLSEFSSKDFNFVFDYAERRLVINEATGGDIKVKRQWWVFHIYPPEFLAEMMIYAIDVFKNKKDEYHDYCKKAFEHASNWDYRKIYPKLLKHLGIE
jgi:glycosyltransferase involved in cell wall biosynthesis